MKRLKFIVGKAKERPTFASIFLEMGCREFTVLSGEYFNNNDISLDDRVICHIYENNERVMIDGDSWRPVIDDKWTLIEQERSFNSEGKYDLILGRDVIGHNREYAIILPEKFKDELMKCYLKTTL